MASMSALVSQRRGLVLGDECGKDEEFVEHDRASVKMEFRSCQRRRVVPLCCGDCDACQTGWVRHEPQQHNEHRNILNRFLSVVRSRTYKSIELSRAALTVPRYGESNRLVGVD